MKKPIVRPADRQALLTQRRRIKMAESAHAYVRGNTLKFYEWLDSTQAIASIPTGPSIWICGDCHIGNIGPVANIQGQVEIQVRDLDQTVIGNPAHDLIRLCLSLAMAARSANLPGVTTALMIEQVVDGYSRALLKKSAIVTADDVGPIRNVMRQALSRRWRHLAQERIEGVSPSIPLGKRFWMLSREERRQIQRMFAEQETRRLITDLHPRHESDEVTVLDAAYWIKGCSSLGRLRFAVLAAIGKNGSGNMCLVDIKEAVQAAAPRDPKAAMPRSNAERVVAGAKALAPFLGNRMLATKLGDRSVVVRELMPQDLKFEVEKLSQDEAIAAANLLARVVGKAHARQMDQSTREIWSKELARARSKTIDAPSWVWSAVLALVASHEAAYLDHCRLYALSKRAA